MVMIICHVYSDHRCCKNIHRWGYFLEKDYWQVKDKRKYYVRRAEPQKTVYISPFFQGKNLMRTTGANGMKWDYGKKNVSNGPPKRLFCQTWFEERVIGRENGYKRIFHVLLWLLYIFLFLKTFAVCISFVIDGCVSFFFFLNLVLCGEIYSGRGNSFIEWFVHFNLLRNGFEERSLYKDSM